ncbi:hypothetical protein BGZ58_009535, partial [Dissophora ornata]
MKPELSKTISLLLWYAVVAYLTGSVLFTLHNLFTQYQESQPSSPIKPKTLTEPGQATFDVENIV